MIQRNHHKVHHRSAQFLFVALILIKKVKKANFETEMRKLNAEQRQQIENYLEAVQHLAFMEEERAYCQGYVDCIQLLGGLGVLNSNPEIEMMVSKMKK